MNVVSVQKVSVEFGADEIFHDVSFDVNDGDVVGLIGANGSGKTTLLKAIIGDITVEKGNIIISSGTKIGYLEQHACRGSTKTVFDEALSVFDYLKDIEFQITDINEKLNDAQSERNDLIIRQEELTDKFNELGGLTYKTRTEATLKGLGFDESSFNLRCTELSGGQRSKLSMCKLLLSRSDLILLDEPTNHLDISGSEWLESFLSSFKGTVIVISHDRYFLDKICNKIVEISNNTSHFQKGNYSEYLRFKQKRIEVEKKHYENQLEEIKRIEGIIRQQKSFARERNFITAESKRKMLEKKREELIEPEYEEKEMRIKFDPDSETGNDVLIAKNLCKSYSGKTVFRNLSVDIYRSERAFIIGKNGCGKTTLLRILKGQVPPDAGYFSYGSNVKVGYFDQSLEGISGGKTVLDEIWDENRLLKETQVRKYLSLFLFKGDDVFKDVDSLSGGEKAKICLLKLMLSGSNVLLLDEPTNHLDIPSREALEDALLNFGGTIIAVSHDRFFINKLASVIYVIKDEELIKFNGTYDDYCNSLIEDKDSKTVKTANKVNPYKLKKERQSNINILKGKIGRTEKQIDLIDEKISEINSILSDPVISSDFQKVMDLTKELNDYSDKQSELMEEWENSITLLKEYEEEILIDT
ncbi:MAG: ABC-F family ATP-binding cassette domain-containing protein [Clostridia bacterium]|nr:ABC-F family ATP-binding cassette domain-containing protein [Clostridia bacterium]